jgi:ASC-1-like (ASCH) protein
MILKAKIKSEYLKAIKEGKKTMEFRQFDGTDKMEVTTEMGHTEMLKILGVSEANEEMEKAIRINNQDITWKENEPIFVFRVEPPSPR